MTDFPITQGAQDRTRISLRQEQEVLYWTQKFRVTKEELVLAVNAAGHSARAVEKYLDGAISDAKTAHAKDKRSHS